ncbi:UNVERIFIED_CONTAM: putative pectinesterase/pectinesterase inhibitor 54 [Sesamum radiatum]|uniref:Pectinesterase n=1 Tax=Sesamum radiatum TaxID=300843 RepID=A0AAW2KN25_SESRA
MGSPKCVVFWVLVIFLSVGSVCRATKGGLDEEVRTQCGFTRYPTLCVQTLTESGSGNPSLDILSALVNRTISETKLPDSNFEILSYHFISPEAQHARIAMDYCQELMSMSEKRLKQALDALKKSPKKHKADIQAWLSAVLTFQQDCKDSVENHAAARLLEQESFPDWVSASDRKLLQSTEIKANAVVAKDGSGNFKTVSEAIGAATGSRFVIYVKAGTYNEKINTNKDGITLIGDGKYSTVITAGSSVGKGGSSLRGSATFTITGDGFIARDIGFQNTAGPGAAQAVALTISSDHSVLYRCSIAGYQDTLYAHSLRQFYRECDIYGTVDFIFGNAAAVFQSCTLVLRRPRSGGAYNVILANGRTDPGQSTGFSVQNCKITVGSDFSPVKNSYNSFLGRPWKEYSRAVVMQSNIDGAISSRGWVEWPGTGGSTYKTLYFAEYENMGPGAGTSGRVKWPGFRVIGTPEASKFTVANFISGNSWLPSTGVTFVSGLQ